MSACQFTVLSVTEHSVYLRDDDLPGTRSVTNAAEDVVRAVHSMYPGRRIFYFDTMGRLDELRHDRGTFIGYAPGTVDPWATRPAVH